jgi:hypothetical protein
MLEADVKTQKSMTQGIPQHDYRPALEGALSWLGDRYLLAEPLTRRIDDQKTQGSEHWRDGLSGMITVQGRTSRP